MAQMLIDKQTAIDLVRDKCLEILDRCDCHYDVDVEDYVYDNQAEFNAILACNKEIRNALSEMPIIDAEPVRHGKWIKADTQQYFRKHYPFFTCSECGYRKDSQKKWNYCPECGARIDAE